jgi:hypothetical protein
LVKTFLPIGLLLITSGRGYHLLGCDMAATIARGCDFLIGLNVKQATIYLVTVVFASKRKLVQVISFVLVGPQQILHW